jgi:C4-dicarboxylate-specific signal transduction histidine kinase
MALGITLSLEPYTTLRTPFLYAAILITTWFGGIGPGLLAVTLATLALGYYFGPPIRRTLAAEAADVPFILSFSLLALLITWVSAKRKSMEKALKQAHDELEAKVRERTSDLQRANEELRIEITERKQAEEAVRQAQAELAYVTRVMTLGELATSIAHEVNQPLAAVVTNGNACLRWLAGAAPNLDEAREAVRRIIRDGKRAGEVIARTRALVRKTGTEMERLDLNEAIREVVALTHAEVRRHGVALQTELAGDLPPVLGDRVQLQQVILNLAMNSLEALASVADRPRELLIGSRHDESDQVLVAVQDCGIGIDRENTENIFNAFYTTKSHGMGMGLAIGRSIVENHGGRLWATANEGPGATFQFTLPKYEEEA